MAETTSRPTSWSRAGSCWTLSWGALYAYVAPLITAGMGGMRDEGIAMEGVRRGLAALDDLDTVALLKEWL